MGWFKFGVKKARRLMLWEYQLLSDQYRELIDYTLANDLKSNQRLCIHGLRIRFKKPIQSDLWQLSWSSRIELGIAIQENNLYEILRIVYGITQKDYAKLDLFNACACSKWISEAFKEIVETEVANLYEEPTEREKFAGVDELQKYGYYNSLDSFTKGNILIQEQWLKLPYAKVFRKMCIDKDRADINKKLHEYASRPNSANHG